MQFDGSGENETRSRARQSAKRMRTPDVLTPEEIMALLKELPEPLRTAAELDAFTGLRRGELIGLQWEDGDFENLVIHVRRSVVTPGHSQDGSFCKGCTARRRFGRVSAQAEAGWSVQSRNRLGVCLTDDERQATAEVLERNGGDDGTRTRGLCRDRDAFARN